MYSKETEQKQFDAITATLSERFADAIQDIDRKMDDLVVTVGREAILRVLELLKDEGFDLLLDIDAVDNLERGGTERFEVIYLLYSIGKNVRIRLKVFVPESDPVLPSATGLWQAANWGEREAYDMIGIRFEGHPNLVRILTHHQFEGHALRKDYPIMKGQWCTETRDMRPDIERDE